MVRTLLLALSFSFLFVACGKEHDPEKQAEIDDQKIQEYIQENELDATKTDSGLYYVVKNLGTGNHPSQNSDVRVRYKGYRLDKSVFDESPEEGHVFNLQQVVQGWTEGIPKFKEGGSGILLIPSHLGYGTKGVSTIEPNEVLIFDIDLLTIID